MDRAGQRCEYCRLPTRGQVATFPIDHILPKSLEGSNAIENLALACPHCNAHKSNHVEGDDPESTRRVPLFNPRAQEWDHHFEWTGAGELAGRTPTGRATVVVLNVNSADMLELRCLLADLGLFPDVVR
jgi:hypothetical protein